MSGFTKIPNEVLDSMNDLNPAAFKLAMALYRKTNGYHKKETNVTLDELQKMTGLSRQGILNARDEISTLFSYAKSGRNITWQLVANQSTELTNQNKVMSQLSRPNQSTELTNNSQLSRPITSSSKKDLKENIKDIYCDLADFFTSQTGLFAPHNSTIEWEDKWKKPLEAIHKHCGEKDDQTKRLIADAVMKSRELKFKIISPKSIYKIALNLTAEERKHVSSGVSSR